MHLKIFWVDFLEDWVGVQPSRQHLCRGVGTWLPGINYPACNRNMDTDTLFIPLGDIFINTMEAEGELCELAGTEGHCSSRGGEAGEREKTVGNWRLRSSYFISFNKWCDIIWGTRSLDWDSRQICHCGILVAFYSSKRGRGGEEMRCNCMQG